ncbi:MAG: hypothetical protein V4504_01980 [Patescibacteria group bacterium]
MEKEKILPKATLGFIIQENKVWLAIKTRHIGKGCRNGYGGGFKNGETSEMCLKRELRGETKKVIGPKYYEKMGIIYFHNKTEEGKKFVCEVDIYLIKGYKGEPKETKEMKDPKKFLINRLPFKKLMPADKKWLPIILSGHKLIAHFYYGPRQKKLIRKEKIKIVKILPKN